MLVNDVLKLHDALRFLAERDVSVSFLQQRSGHLVGLRVSRDDAVKLLDRLSIFLLRVKALADPVGGVAGKLRIRVPRSEVAEAGNGQIVVASLEVAIRRLIDLHRVFGRRRGWLYGQLTAGRGWQRYVRRRAGRGLGNGRLQRVDVVLRLRELLRDPVETVV